MNYHERGNQKHPSRQGTEKKNPWVLPIILIVLLVPIIAAAVILYGRIATVASVHLVDQDFYRMTVKQDYFLDEVLEANLSSEETLAKYLTHKMYFGLADGFVQNLEFGCSSFLARTPDGEYIAGRNYDYDEAGELVFYTHPSDGFAAVCMTEFGALGLNETTGILPDSFLGKTAMMLAPYYTMDGVNKKGVMVSLLQLTPGAPHPRTEKPDIMLTVAIRLILDRAESVDHAIALLEQYDVHDDGKYSHHLFISDSNGNAVVVEWPGAQMKVVKDQPAVTNFVLSRGNKSTFIGNCDRFDKIMDWLDNHSTTTSEQAMELLEAISQTDTGYPTQWSSVYHLSDCSMNITIDRHYDKVYHFSPKDFK